MSDHDAPSSTRRPRCPRCGYDLRGASERWRTSCPLDGECTECGLGFRWRDIFHPQFSVPLWYYEHGLAGSVPCLRVVRSAMHGLRPFHFWSRVPIHAPLERARLLAVSMLIACLLLAGFFGGFAGVVAADLAHQNQGAMTRPPAIAVVRAVVMPLSTEPVAELRADIPRPGGGTTKWVHLLYSPREFLERTWKELWPVLSVLLFAPLAGGLAYAALPVSRRLARVRARHIVRIVVALYVQVMPVALLVIAAASLNRIAFGSSLSTNVALAALAAFGALIPFTLLWWWAATRHYLRMPHAPAVALSVWFIGWFAPVAFSGLAWTLQ